MICNKFVYTRKHKKIHIPTKKMKQKTGKTNPPTKRRRKTRSQEYEGGGGVIQIVYEKHPYT